MATTLKVNGMSCGHCVMAVKKALANVPGVTTIDVKIGEATFEGDANAVKTAIEDAGYDVVGTK